MQVCEWAGPGFLFTIFNRPGPTMSIFEPDTILALPVHLISVLKIFEVSQGLRIQFLGLWGWTLAMNGSTLWLLTGVDMIWIGGLEPLSRSVGLDLALRILDPIDNEI